MDQSLKRLSALVATIVLAGGCSREQPPVRPEPPAGAAVGDLNLAPCIHVARDVEYAAECGTLIVPENRYDDTSRLLALPVKRIRASGDAVLFATFMGLYSVDGAAPTFDIWLAAAEGDYSGMALVTAAFMFMLPSDFAWGDSASKAYSAEYDYNPAVDYVAEVTPDPYLMGSPGSSMGWAGAPVWPANKIPDEYRMAQPSSVETLMLSGTLDVSTPAQNARNQLLPLLENGEQIVLSEFAHTGDLFYLQREATRHLLTNFFATGKVDASHYRPNRVNFEPSWGFPLVAKLAVAGAVLILSVIVLLLWFSIRLLRRRLQRHQN